MISIGSFEGIDTQAKPIADTETSDSPGFDTILDSIAGMMQTAPQPITAPVVAPTTPKGWNPDIEKLKAALGIDAIPTGPSPDKELPTHVAPILINPHAKVEQGPTRQPPRLPEVEPTPDIFVIQGKDRTKQPPVVAQTPDIIVLPGKDTVKQTPDIIVVPPKEPVKQTPDIIVMPTSPTKPIPGTPPVVGQTPDIIVGPTRQPPVRLPNGGQTPDIIVQPTRQPPIKPPVNGDSPDIIVLPTNPGMQKLPLVTIQDRKMNGDAVRADLKDGQNVNPIQPDVEIVIEPTSVQVTGDFESSFNPGKVTLQPKFDAGRLTGFTVAPESVESIVKSLNPTASPLNNITFSQQSNDPTPRLNVVTATIKPMATTEKTTDAGAASNLSRFWLTSDANPKPANGKTIATSVETEPSAIGQTTKPAEARISGDAVLPARPALFEKLTAEIKAATEPTLVKPAAEALEEVGARESGAFEEGTQPLKFERFMANAANDVVKTTSARTEPAAAAQVADQVNPHLLELAAMASRKQDKQTMKLRLHPAELGSVEIRLERTEAGAVNAFFTTETDGARQALTQNMDQLRDSLRQSGWQVGQMDVASGGTSDAGRQQNESQPRNSQVFNDFLTSPGAEQTASDERNSPNRLLSLLA